MYFKLIHKVINLFSVKHVNFNDPLIREKESKAKCFYCYLIERTTKIIIIMFSEMQDMYNIYKTFQIYLKN